MFQVEVTAEEVLQGTRSRLAEVEHELVVERLKSAKLSEALMRLHQGEVLTTGPSEEATTGPGGAGETAPDTSTSPAGQGG